MALAIAHCERDCAAFDLLCERTAPFSPEQVVVECVRVDIKRGECLYVAPCRADATVFDPSNGDYPPLVLYTIN